MEQSAEREDSKLILLKLPWEDIVCGIDQDRGYRVFPKQSWSVYAFLSAVLYFEINSHHTCQGSKQPYSSLATWSRKSKDSEYPTTTFLMLLLKPAGQLHPD